MNENTLARRIMLKTSFAYATKYSTSVMMEFFADTAAAPERYRAAIQSAPVNQQAGLNRLLDLFIRIAVENISLHTPPADIVLEAESINQLTDQPLDLRPLLRLYFVDGSMLTTDFLMALNTIRKP